MVAYAALFNYLEDLGDQGIADYFLMLVMWEKGSRTFNVYGTHPLVPAFYGQVSFFLLVWHNLEPKAG